MLAMQKQLLLSGGPSLRLAPAAWGMVSVWAEGSITADRYGSNTLTASGTPSLVGSVGKPGLATLFASATPDYASIASNSSLAIGNQDMALAAWVKLTNKTLVQELLGKITAGAAVEYVLDYESVSDRFRFIVGNGTTAVVVPADILGSPIAGVWYHLFGVHDSVNNLGKFWINGIAQTSIAFADGLADLGGSFAVGRGGSYTLTTANAAIGQAVLFKPSSNNMAANGQTIANTLFGNNAGIRY